MKIRTILMMMGLMGCGFAQKAEGTEPEENQAAVADQDAVRAEFDDADPFAPVGGYGSPLSKIPEKRLAERRSSLRLRVEVWEVEGLELVRALDGFEEAEAVANWRRKLVDGGGRLVHAPVLCLEEKSRSQVETVMEDIYPTEYEPPEILPEEAIMQLVGENSPGSLSEVIAKLTTGASPTAFETRNTGLSLEAEIQPVTAEKGCWDLSVALEDIKQVGKASYGDEALDLKMPIFSSYRTNGLLRVAEGRWQMLAVASAPRNVGQTETGKSWVTILRIDPARESP